MGGENLGEFEHQVMLAVLRRGGEAYSVAVVEELETRIDRRASQAAVFIAMQRLEKRGLLVSRVEEPGKGDAKRVRKYFRITPRGMAQLRETRQSLSRLWAGIEPQLDKG